MRSAPPTVHVEGFGNMANQMIRAMAAMAIQSQVPGCELSGVNLPEWGIGHPARPTTSGAIETYASKRAMKLDIDGIAERLRSGQIHRVQLSSFAQHIDNFLPVDVYRKVFVDRLQSDERFGRDDLVINLRGNEILQPVHPDYTLIPVAFYAEVIARTGLNPVFVGQIGEDCYIERLRRAFPRARFIPSAGPMQDFALLRQAHHIVVAVSTFSWLAAWLSHAERIIVPLTGFYNPAQCPETDLLPRGDDRYEYYLFPVNYAVAVEAHEIAHRGLQGRWRRIAVDEIDAIRDRMPLNPIRKADFLARFDAAFYLAANSAVREAVAAGRFASAYEEYVAEGFQCGRLPCAFDRVGYAHRYPEAAVAVANGHYAGLFHHWIAQGGDMAMLPAPAASVASTRWQAGWGWQTQWASN